MRLNKRTEKKLANPLAGLTGPLDVGAENRERLARPNFRQSSARLASRRTQPLFSTAIPRPRRSPIDTREVPPWSRKRLYETSRFTTALHKNRELRASSAIH